MRGLALIGAVAASLAACGGDAAERAFFERAQALKQTGQFKLADAVPGDWTSVCFHGGYAEAAGQNPVGAGRTSASLHMT